MTSLRFQAKIEINGINPFVPVDAEQAARLREGWRKPMPVLVQVNGAPAPAHDGRASPLQRLGQVDRGLTAKLGRGRWKLS